MTKKAFEELLKRSTFVYRSYRELQFALYSNLNGKSALFLDGYFSPHPDDYDQKFSPRYVMFDEIRKIAVIGDLFEITVEHEQFILQLIPVKV